MIRRANLLRFFFFASFFASFLSGCGNPLADRENAAAPLAIEARGLGDAAAALLSDREYDQLVIEVAAVKGREPEPESLDYLQHFLEKYLRKPRGIRVVTGTSIPEGKRNWRSIQDIEAMERQYRRAYASGRTLSVFLLFVDGYSALDQKPINSSQRTLGSAYGSTSIVLFSDAILREAMKEEAEQFEPILTYGVVEKFTLAHEFGHLLGLVAKEASHLLTNANNSFSTGYKVTDYHCENPKCLMYFRVGRDTLDLDDSGNAMIPDFDVDCQGDLRAVGGK